MKPVTTGPGISGTFSDDLVILVSDLRVESKNSGWRLYIEAVPGHGYSLRIYAPDLHSEVYAVRRNLKTLETIRQILANEWSLWQSRVRAAVALTTG
jgi:hypothetical protein